MAYTINKNGGTITVADDTLNEQTSLRLVGKDYIGYGEAIAQNSVSLLENFASETAPTDAKAIEGQLWWKPADDQLSVRSNGTWLGIDSDSKVTTVLDTSAVAHTVVVSKVNEVVTSITSSDTTDWVINVSETTLEPFFRDNGLIGTPGAATIKAGINLNTDSTKAMKFHGTATTAQYADVAELYVSDKEYGPGHVMKIGGAEEVTETSEAADTDVLGIVTTDPALLMNSKLAGVTVGIALLGRVPCKVTGQNVNEHSYQHVIGRALQSKTTPGEGVIEVIVGVK